jgi:16S rRNA A1518/A1519 N6-dimethyltransferase RsmA/KsgA/DIM1 with predicted DNA glycosylase/AP lyase activity
MNRQKIETAEIWNESGTSPPQMKKEFDIILMTTEDIFNHKNTDTFNFQETHMTYEEILNFYQIPAPIRLEKLQLENLVQIFKLLSKWEKDNDP